MFCWWVVVCCPRMATHGSIPSPNIPYFLFTERTEEEQLCVCVQARLLFIFFRVDLFGWLVVKCKFGPRSVLHMCVFAILWTWPLSMVRLSLYCGGYVSHGSLLSTYMRLSLRLWLLKYVMRILPERLYFRWIKGWMEMGWEVWCRVVGDVEMTEHVFSC